LAKDSDILIHLKNANGKTPLETAKNCHQDQEIIALLEEYKQRTSVDGLSPIEQALPGALIGRVRDAHLRQCLRELRKDPTQIKDHAGRTLLQLYAKMSLQPSRPC